MPIAPFQRGNLNLVLLWLSVAGGYMVVSLGAYALPFPSKLTPFWPGPAVAVTALCLGGWRMIPGVMAGALGTAVATGAPWFMASVITTTATLESVLVWQVGSLLQPHWWRFDRRMAVVAFAIPTFFATGLAALAGCLGLEAAGALGGFTLQNLAVWWIGDGVGMLIMVPLLLSLAGLPWRYWTGARPLELAAAIGVLAIFGGGVYAGIVEDPVIEAILAYMTFPILVWVAVRFEVPGASLGLLAITLISLAGTAQGHGPFAGEAVFDSLLMLQGFVAVVGLTALVLAVEVGHRRRTQNALRESRERLNFALWGTDLGLWDWDLQSGEIYFNEQWARLLGFRADELKSDFAAWESRMHPADRDRVKALLEAHLEDGLPYFEADLRVRNKRGEWRWVQTRGKVVERDASGNALRATGTHRDIDAGKRQEQELARRNAELRDMQEEREALLRQLRERSAQFERHAREDHLTSLPNRRFFEETLEREWERARRFQRPLSLAMADLDHFKAVNDEHSHQLGDQVLQRLARLVEKRLRRTDFVARYGGEEFVLVFPETDADEAVALCERLRQVIESGGWEELTAGLRVTCSFGVAEYAEAESSEALVALADRRLYRAKRAGRNRVLGPASAGGEPAEP